MKACYLPYQLVFKRPSGTSRGILTHKKSWFIKLETKGKVGYGECGLLEGLSIDDVPDYEQKLAWLCQNIELPYDLLSSELQHFPSLLFGLEMALQSLNADNPYILFPSAFTKGDDSIPINGLVWMGEYDFMKDQIEEKLAQKFRCIKLKIGAIDFKKELLLLEKIRQDYNAEKVEIRVDANGAFLPQEALEKLSILSEFSLHSIEQPIKQKQYEAMAALCEKTPLPIALDEELIGIIGIKNKIHLLDQIKPQYIILKPSLIGGFKATKEWIELAEKRGIGWWITSALESNIGLNAIAQFTYSLNTKIPQGLGTGSLYTNNFQSPLNVINEQLYYHPNTKWGFNLFE